MKIGIIGTGIAGNAASWLLNQTFDITVFEQNDYVGGHANTVSVDGYDPVDTGFIVYNEWTYPNFIALMNHLNVETTEADMSFGVSLDHGKIEYAGDALFAQKRNLFRPAYYRMLMDIVRFYKKASSLLEEEREDISLQDYLDKNKYSDAFIRYHLLPMAAAIWSTSEDDVRHFPARSFVQFFVNHGLFLFKDRPQWRTVKGGSRSYVSKMTEAFSDKIRKNDKVVSCTRTENGVRISTKSGGEYDFDKVVIACHADQALEILSDADEIEKEVLSCFPYAKNTAYLHKDESFMPRRKKAWSSWNYLCSTSDNRVCLTYWMNKLQTFLSPQTNLFVTLNPEIEPDKDKTLRKIEYHHPQYTGKALKGWGKIYEIQGRRNVWFCGAWCGYGFHEDGLSAGLAVAEAIGAPKRPWDVKDKSPAGKNAIG